jgi:hypothetical protein
VVETSNPGTEVNTPPLDLEAIFGKTQPDQLKPQDVNAFWETALDQSETKVGGLDGISFDQARQMGLAPKDD